ncbi:MAG: aminotransferase class I/II-fold pyridoxal phosphate-dependent enzyme [candidate division Zixibacteria bacterium]|nr:aminotransferase class I/II-fold pyridoxal phosphate-dependent enzyme [candidate division Zixibacteria bacterium]
MEIRISQRVAATPPYPFAEIDAKVRALRERGVDVVDFGVGDPTSPTPDFVVAAVAEAARARATAGYPAYEGDPDYRAAAAEYIRREFGVALDPDREVASTAGSKEAVFHFPLGFVDGGDVVICPTPGYPPYKNGTRFAGGVPYFVPLLEENDFLIDYDAIPEDVCRRAKVIWTNYPNSPTGKVAPGEWLEGLLKWARQYGIIVAADEGCYHEVYFGKRPASVLEVGREGVIVFYSLSKRNNMTCYRVGFVAGDERIISVYKKVKTNVDSGTPTFIQDAAAAALRDRDHAAQMREEYRAKRRVMLTALANAALPPCQSEATFYLWQKAPAGMSGVDLAGKLLEIGVVTTPGEWITDATAEGVNPGRDFVRFALVPPAVQVEAAAARLAVLDFRKR